MVEESIFNDEKVFVLQSKIYDINLNKFFSDSFIKSLETHFDSVEGVTMTLTVKSKEENIDDIITLAYPDPILKKEKTMIVDVNNENTLPKLIPIVLKEGEIK